MRRIQVEVASLQEARVVVQDQRVQPVGEVASYFGVVELLRAAEAVFGLDPTAIEIEITQHDDVAHRSEEHTSELQSLMSISYAVLCLTKKRKEEHTTC